jgi:hypothetical protein
MKGDTRMALSADELVKQEIFDELGTLKKYRIRIFMQSSNKDQDLFSEGGLTFGVNGTKYGSCDAAWELPQQWMDPFDGKTYKQTPVVALEATDALNRKSSGNAQYQRFHHALGAVRGGSVGFYYLRPGVDDIRPELYGMANFATQMETGSYFVTDDLEQIRRLLETDFGTPSWEAEILSLSDNQQKLFDDWFKATYGNWEQFAKKRSTIIKPGYVIKHAGRMLRNFTDSSQRAGHIAVGEMFLTKYFFGLSNVVYYLFPRMKRSDFDYLDKVKSSDKEWRLLRDEPKVVLLGLDDLSGVPMSIKSGLEKLKETPLKGQSIRNYNSLVKDLENLINIDSVKIKDGVKLSVK